MHASLRKHISHNRSRGLVFNFFYWISILNAQGQTALLELAPLYNSECCSFIYRKLCGIQCTDKAVPGFSEKFSPQQLIWMIWWCHDMDMFSALMALCEENPPLTCGFPLQWPMISSDVDLSFTLTWTCWTTSWVVGDLRNQGTFLSISHGIVAYWPFTYWNIWPCLARIFQT